MKLAKGLLWFLALSVLMNPVAFAAVVGGRVPANRKLLEFTVNNKDVAVYRVDRAMIRGKTTPEALDKNPVVVGSAGNQFCQVSGLCSVPKCVLQPVTGNPRELEFPAECIGFDERSQSFRFSLGRPDKDGIIRPNAWAATFQLRSDQIGGGVRQESNPPEMGLSGSTSFAVDMSRERFESLIGRSPLHVKGKFLLAPVNMIPTLNGTIFLAFDANHWHADPEFHFLGAKDFDILVDNGEGFFQVPICGMKGFNKRFNIGVSTTGDGLIDSDKWMTIDSSRARDGAATDGNSYILTLTDNQIAEVCK